MPVIETAAACAMLHSFYTEIEKLLRIIASDLDEQLPSGESWHRDLLSQMARPTPLRPAVITVDMVSSLGEFLAFRHLFRGASIALMRWDRLSPLLAKIDNLHRKTVSQFEEFQKFLQGKV